MWARWVCRITPTTEGGRLTLGTGGGWRSCGARQGSEVRAGVGALPTARRWLRHSWVCADRGSSVHVRADVDEDKGEEDGGVWWSLVCQLRARLASCTERCCPCPPVPSHCTISMPSCTPSCMIRYSDDDVARLDEHNNTRLTTPPPHDVTAASRRPDMHLRHSADNVYSTSLKVAAVNLLVVLAARVSKS